MLHTLLKPRWLGLLVLLALVVVVFGRLGLWQMSAARDEVVAEQLAEQAARPPAPVEQLVAPHQAFPADGVGRPVTAAGTYDATRQFLVPDRRLRDIPGYWVVTPLVLDSTGASLPVLRGFVTDPADADTPPADPVVVTGTLAPGEGPVESTTTLPEGQLGSVDLSVLANAWDGPLYNAFVFATSEQPPLTAESVQPVPPPSFLSEEVDWRNLGYALQWWVFALFATYMFWRLVRDDHWADLAADQAAERHTVDAPQHDERTHPRHV